jgi:hypothetical protein
LDDKVSAFRNNDETDIVQYMAEDIPSWQTPKSFRQPDNGRKLVIENADHALQREVFSRTFSLTIAVSHSVP